MLGATGRTGRRVAALAAEGDQEPTGDVERVAGRPPTAFEEYVAAVAARGAWRD
ncbi:MAG TPA: hypothetical protein VNZ62_09120 [Capillimicrobium sp.]|nr:hypothetical protein [Capillimicrobium sp.]